MRARLGLLQAWLGLGLWLGLWLGLGEFLGMGKIRFLRTWLGFFDDLAEASKNLDENYENIAKALITCLRSLSTLQKPTSAWLSTL